MINYTGKSYISDKTLSGECKGIYWGGELQSDVSAKKLNSKCTSIILGDKVVYGFDYPALAQILSDYPALAQILSDKPQLAAFLNEDNDLVHSLVETSKTRWLVGDGVAYVDTGVIPDNTTYMYTKFKVLEIGNDYINCISYADYASNVRAFGISSWDGRYLFNHGNYHFTNKATNIGDIIEYTNNAGMSLLEWDGGNYSLNSNSVFTCPSSLIIGGISRNGTKDPSNSKGAIFSNYILKHYGVEINLVPCQHDNQAGMLDILSCTFYPNANTEGSFTIQLTDKE